VLATGEAPVVGWGRVPPGYLLWVPLSVFIMIFAFIAGGWAASAGQGLYALVHGEVAPAGAEEPRLWAIALLVVVFLLTAFAKRISRTLELANWVMVGTILAGLLLIDLFVVPFELWWEGIRGFLTPAAPPDGITATQLGGLAGFTALASGLNWYVMGHYRDKGYGMGYRTGFISGLRGEQKKMLDVGVTFPADEANTGRWRRWYRLLLVDMWGVFFIGAMVGMLLPTILMAHAVEVSGTRPTAANVPTFVASVLESEYGRGMFYVALGLGVLILFSTQLGIFEAIVRVATDTAHATSPRLRAMIDGDPRRFYFPFMLMHLNSRLPKPARPRPWHYVLLTANVVFFGFFFINFIADFFGDPLVTF
jgi:hypothetical protein